MPSNNAKLLSRTRRFIYEFDTLRPLAGEQEIILGALNCRSILSSGRPCEGEREREHDHRSRFVVLREHYRAASNRRG